MFKKVTKSIAKQMDPRGELVPVHSILDHEHFRPLCLVKRKRKTIFRPSPYYERTGYSLWDVLLPGEDDKSTEALFPNGGGQNSRQFTVKKSCSDKVDGGLSLSVDSTSIEVKAATSLSKGWSIKLEKHDIPVSKLEALREERKINENHTFLQQLKKTRQNLYVVHETLEASEDAIYEESTEGEGSFKTQLYAKFCAKGASQNNQGITIPKGCTLAFRAIQLNITGGVWNLQYFPQDDSLFVSDGISQGKIRTLEAEVQEICRVLSALPSDLLATLLKAIKAAMRDKNLFEELTHKMVEVDESGSCELKTESPDLKDLLSSLQHSSGDNLLTGAITYTLDALDELTEDQRQLLDKSVDKKIIHQQLQLVKHILEQNAEHGIEFKCGSFSLDASLPTFTAEEQNLTTAIVEMSGVTLQEDNSAVYTEEAFPAVAALYVSLYVLNLLSKSD
ncbi:gasdermin-A [Porphyrio hochstetteri]